MVPRATRHLLLHLRSSPAPTWGYVIYRTTYTPRSQQQFPRIIHLLNSYLKRAIFEEHASAFNFSTGQPYPKTDWDLIWARHRNVIMDGAQFNKLSLDSVRSHFETWAENDGIRTAQHRVCLVVDEEVLQALADAQLPGEGQPDAETTFLNMRKWWVKAVEAWPDFEESSYEDIAGPYDGTMKCSVFLLWTLFQDKWDPHPMGQLTRDENNLYTG